MNNLFLPVPETTLPGGLVVPDFEVQQYHYSAVADGTPTTYINYCAAIQAAQFTEGSRLIRESQALAIAYQIAAQDENWTGGKIGKGKLHQGYRKGTYGAKPRDFTPDSEDQRRWHILPGGHRIYDFAGHIYSWVFDDIQGDEHGIVAKPFAKDSPSLGIPSPAEDMGQGWTPSAGSDWSGGALIRGGCWYSESNAGAFNLSNDWPGNERGGVGFRCTK